MFRRIPTFHVAISNPEAHASGSLASRLPFQRSPGSGWLVLLLGTSWPVAAATQPAWHEGFEGPDPSWRNAGGDAIYHILQQQRVQGHAHSGQR